MIVIIECFNAGSETKKVCNSSLEQKRGGLCWGPSTRRFFRFLQRTTHYSLI